MKNLAFLCLLLAAFACHKKTTTPTPVPDPPAPCVTHTKLFEGKYKLSSDTITITFLNNRCPLENQNVYVVLGLGKAMNNLYNRDTSYHFSLLPDTLLSSEINKKAGILKSGVDLKIADVIEGGLWLDCAHIHAPSFSTALQLIK